MVRQILVVFGNFFSNKLTEIFMGIIAALVYWFFGFQQAGVISLPDVRGLTIGVTLIIVFALAGQILGAVFIWASEKVPLSIEINDGLPLDRIIGNENGVTIIGHIASLQ